MTVIEFVEEWFESEALKTALAAVAIHGATLGPMSAGTGFTLLHNWLNRGGLSHVNVGRAGEITRALAEAVTAYGGEIRTEAEVVGIQVDKYTSTGVVLENGDEIAAAIVVSALDPKRTFLSLVGAVQFAAGIRLAGTVHQDARLGGQAPFAHGWQARNSGWHAGSGARLEISGARLRRRQIRRDLAKIPTLK